MAQMFKRGLNLQEVKTQRETIMRTIDDKNPPNDMQISILENIALDETEDKAIRKKAIRNLAFVGIDKSSIFELLELTEQGVQRLSFNYLNELY